MTVELRTMSEAEFAAYRDYAIAEYAKDNVRAGTMLSAEAPEAAKRQFEELLPDGAATEGNHLLLAEHDGERVGILWLQIRAPKAFVYDIEVDEPGRGRGHGRAIMLAGQAFAHERGAASIGLHVFADNSAAVRLYEMLGYDVVSQKMSRTLP
ncbi:GNAT family N-acetyltransferase [Solicola gregarius]|uniref:GNAT family N-acetyltransferase n=1 Tax=Solicola gregarius TaxID=2908642 RepID=A0AA46TH88_9ACTN|nr:GNAT family N-acetyltransferase [Solicola gregarius]UYM04463.1 GNAT family N-acetyltransferase [Solicola gregarius]